jgi:phosphatidylglycerophosphatase C
MDHVYHSLHSGNSFQKNENVMKNRIAFFDFDGTITTKDSLLSFIIFRNGKFKTVLGLMILSPYYLAYILKIIPVQTAKEKILRYFFRNLSIEKFQSDCNEFSSTILLNLVRPKALDEITRLQEKGVAIVIISASPENWLRPWTERTGADLLSTRLETRDGKLTGKIEGRNCRGKEKVRRIMTRYDLNQYEEVYCYGDTKGDKPMLQLATHAFYKPFR